MFRDFILFVKHPYAAGIIAAIWFGSTALLAIDGSLPLVQIVMINMGSSLIIALIGFNSKQ